MIESIHIHDFQAHKELVLDLDPAVTVITGRSDVGKSAIIRAFQWVCTNQPSGEAFIRNGRKKVSIALTVDGVTIRRRRGGTLNEYRFQKQTLKAFGQGKVPKPIKDFLALDAVNFQEQLDPPFWFKQSPGEVARELNQVIDLTTIDDVLARAAKNTRAASTKATAAEQRVTDAETRAQDLRWVSFMLPEFEALEVARVAWTETSQVTSRLRVLLEDLSHAKSRADDAGERASGAGRVLSAARKHREALSQRTRLGKLYQALTIAKAQVDFWETRPSTTGIDQAYETWTEIKGKRSKLAKLLKRARDQKAELCVAQKQLAKSEQELIAVSKKCPTCGQPIRQ